MAALYPLLATLITFFLLILAYLWRIKKLQRLEQQEIYDKGHKIISLQEYEQQIETLTEQELKKLKLNPKYIELQQEKEKLIELNSSSAQDNDSLTSSTKLNKLKQF